MSLLKVLSNNSRLDIILAANSNVTAKYHLPCSAVNQMSSTVNPDDVIPRYNAFSDVTSSTTVSGRYAMFFTGDAVSTDRPIRP